MLDLETKVSEIKCKQQTVEESVVAYTHAGVVLRPGVVVEIAASQHVVVHVPGIVE